MEYVTVYDIALVPFRWWRAWPCTIFLVGVSFPYLLYVSIPESIDERRRQVARQKMLRFTAVLLACWSIAMALASGITWPAFAAARKAYLAGEYETTEGRMAELRTAGGSEGVGVSGFYVVSDDGQRHSFVSPLPDDADIQDLRLRQGDMLRVLHRGGQVLRVDVAIQAGNAAGGISP